MEARNIQKVVLINLPTEGKVADFYTPKYAIESFANYPPLGLLYVAAGIKDSYQVKVLTCRRGAGEFKKPFKKSWKKALSV